MARAVPTARNSRMILGALVLGHLVAISHQVDGGGGATLLEKIVFTLLSPPQRAVSALVRGLGDAWSGYLDLRGTRAENLRLKQQVAYLDAELQKNRQQANEATRLRELLELQKILPFATVGAEVVARDGLPWFRTLTLNRGSESGIRLNAPVLSPLGVVGRVVAVGTRAARVQILLDRDSGVGVMVERSRVTGVASGQVGVGSSATTDLALKYVSSVSDVEIGDVVVTSGLDRVFPKGLLVGRVRSVGLASGLFREILVAPSAPFDRIEDVLVVTTSPEDPVFTQSVKGPVTK